MDVDVDVDADVEHIEEDQDEVVEEEMEHSEDDRSECSEADEVEEVIEGDDGAEPMDLDLSPLAVVESKAKSAPVIIRLVVNGRPGTPAPQGLTNLCSLFTVVNVTTALVPGTNVERLLDVTLRHLPDTDAANILRNGAGFPQFLRIVNLMLQHINSMSTFRKLKVERWNGGRAPTVADFTRLIQGLPRSSVVSFSVQVSVNHWKLLSAWPRMARTSGSWTQNGHRFR